MRGGGKRAVWVAHRRSGKDVTCWQYMIEQAAEIVGLYYYCLPEFTHSRRVIWEGLLNDGKRFLSLIPEPLIKSKNDQQMKVELVNGSIIQLVGSDQYDRLIGTNPRGIVFSEYSVTHPMAWLILRPILAANGGWAIFNGTPRGKNHFHDILLQAKTEENWFWSVDTVKTTNAISEEVLAIERREMDRDIYLQEYECSFDAALKGAYYSEQIASMREQNRLCKVPYDNKLVVYTAFDPGDSVTAMVFFQVYGKEVRIIDAEEFSCPSVESIYTFITQKPYKYGKHFLPFDATVSQMATGMSLLEQFKKLGLQNAVDLPQETSKMDGIMLVKSAFPSFWVDISLEKKLINPLSSYAPKYSETKHTYSAEPEHNWASHMCTLGNTLIKMSTGWKKIEDIVAGEFVKIGDETALVTNSSMVGERETLKITFTNGAVLECTPEHKIFTTRGVVLADSLAYNDHVLSEESLWQLRYLMKSPMGLRDAYIESIKEKNTGSGKAEMFSAHKKMGFIGSSIVLFGRIYMELFQKTWSYIQKICAILFHGKSEKEIVEDRKRSLISFKSSKEYAITKSRQDTLSAPMKMEGDTFIEISGKHQMEKSNQASMSTIKMATDQTIPWKILSFFLPVSTANYIANLIIGLGQKRTGDNYQKRGESLLHYVVEKVEKNHEKKSVYDITVQKHHCYLANGILVSNSDSVRYMVIALRQLTAPAPVPPQRKPLPQWARRCNIR